MRYLIALILLIPTSGYSQNHSISSVLEFDSHFSEAADRWAALPKTDEDSSYQFGFIYIDEEAGFTFNYESEFSIDDDRLIRLPTDSAYHLKIRFGLNSAGVALLTENQVRQLNLPDQPEWLDIYKEGSKTPEFLKNIGYHYNHVGASLLAIEPLLEAYQEVPHLEGLEFELAYAYNATKNYSEAIAILEKAIENDADNFWFYRELGYAYKNLDQIEKAEKTNRKALKLTDDPVQKAEVSINMAQYYIIKGNKRKFKEWAKRTRQFSEKGSQFHQYIDMWEEELDLK